MEEISVEVKDSVWKGCLGRVEIPRPPPVPEGVGGRTSLGSLSYLEERVAGMPGKQCPNCGRRTVYRSGYLMQCSSCGWKVILRPGPGRGKKCPSCGRFTFHKEYGCSNPDCPA